MNLLALEVKKWSLYSIQYLNLRSKQLKSNGSIFFCNIHAFRIIIKMVNLAERKNEFISSSDIVEIYKWKKIVSFTYLESLKFEIFRYFYRYMRLDLMLESGNVSRLELNFNHNLSFVCDFKLQFV